MVLISACGFNAHNQLVAPTSDAAAPEDLRSLIEIGQGTEVRVLFTGWSSTVLLLDDTIVLHGHLSSPRDTEAPLKVQLPHGGIKRASEIRSVFGDLNGPLGLITWTGHVYTLDAKSHTELKLTPRGDSASPTLSHVAITGAGRTAIVMLQGRGSSMIHILEFDSFSTFEQWYTKPSAASEVEGSTRPFKRHMQSGRAVTLLSGATCFVLLTEEGEIFSWGDGRHERCLGRVPDAQSPANQPSMITALGGVHITKIDGCGWMFGALSKENDMYFWGRDKPGTQLALGTLLGSRDEEVKLLDDERFENVSDFAVGNGHVVVAATQGNVYALGLGLNGQIGLGDAFVGFVTTWSKIAYAEHGQTIKLASGPASTFLISSTLSQDTSTSETGH